METDQFVVGALVQYPWDTGAFGLSLLYGKVIASGQKTFTVRWESGIVNRIRRERARHLDVKPVEDRVEAEKALERAEQLHRPREE